MKKSRFKHFGTTVILTVILCSVIYNIQNPEIRSVFSPSHFADKTIVIDAGHGGEDGGAVSVSGAIESHINLDIALRLDELFGLFGVNTVLLRDSDISLHDADANSLREKKVSDLKNRVEMIESISDPTVISIHQNTYSNSKYHGAQVFFANGEISRPLAQITQETLKETLDSENNRQPTAVPDSVYLMNHISCEAILVECGFLSNPEEDRLLQTEEYRIKLAAALAGSYIKHHQTNLERGSFDAS